MRRLHGSSTPPGPHSLERKQLGLEAPLGNSSVAWVSTTGLAIQRTTGRNQGEVLVANLAGFAAWTGVMSLLTTGSSQIGLGPFLAESIWEAVTGAHVFFGA